MEYAAEKQRVWIELEVPVVRTGGGARTNSDKGSPHNVVDSWAEQRSLMEQRAQALSRMLRRLGVEGEDRIFVHTEKDIHQYAALDSSGLMTVLNDNGQWFNLGYLGRED